MPSMRHSKPDLTANVYTDPKLLDVAGALDSLPLLPLDVEPQRNKNIAKATGTDSAVPVLHANKAAPNLVLNLVRATDNRCISESFAGKMTGKGNVGIGAGGNVVSACPVKRKTPLTSPDSGVHHMEVRGLEPLTFSMPSRRSPN